MARPWRTVLSFALAAAAGGCGTLASSDYQPPPIAAINGFLTLPAGASTILGSPIRVLLVWQLADWTPALNEIWWQGNPLLSTTSTGMGAAALSCARPPVSCELDQTLSCNVRYGLAEQVATLPSPGQGGSITFEVPIYGAPPASARRALTSRSATLAIGYLVFLGESPGPGGAGIVLANSAFSGASLVSTPYRTSSYVTYLEGSPPVASRPGTNPGLLDRLEPGFGLVLKLEREDGHGRLVPVALSKVPVDTQVALDGHAPDEGGAWCEAVAIDQAWWPTPGAIPNESSCSTNSDAFSCDEVIDRGNCWLNLRRYQFDAACTGPPATGACLPDTFSAAGPGATAVSFQPLPSGSVLALGAAAPNELEAAEVLLYEPTTPRWWQARPLSFPRAASTVTLLPSGEVLVIGGSLGDDSRTAERFTPGTGMWIRTCSMVTPRKGQTATLLPSGEVLVLGGTSDASPGGSWGGELYDPAQGTWLPFDTQLVGPPLIHHAALLLLSGEVLVTGPEGGPETFICARLAGCHAAGAMNAPHPGGTFTRLLSGEVLAIGGRVDPTGAELFDPLSESWRPVRAMPSARVGHAALLLPSGEVLVAGGEPVGGTVSSLATAERYDPLGDLWTGTAGPLVTGRSGFTLAASATGEVLVLGGQGGTGQPLPLERYCRAPATP